MSTDEAGDDDSENYSNFGAEPGFVPVQQNRVTIIQREAQPYQRDQQQPRQKKYPSAAAGDEEPCPDNGGVDRLPSFITGSQPQVNGGRIPKATAIRAASAATASRHAVADVRMARVRTAWCSRRLRARTSIPETNSDLPHPFWRG